MLGFFLKTMELSLVILFISYHFGIVWIILVEGIQDYVNDDPTHTERVNFIS